MTVFGERSKRLPLLMAGVVALLVINTLLSATRYLSIESAYRVPFDESPVWATSELEVELARFMVAFDGFVNRDPNITKDVLTERFDVAWSRLNLFSAGVNARWVQGRAADKEELGRIHAALTALDPVVERAEPGDMDALRKAREAILPRMPAIMRMTTASLQDEVEARTRLEHIQADLRSEIKIFAISALATFFGLMAYLVRAEATSRANVRALTRAQAAAQAASDRLSEAIANINEGFVLYDRDDRLVVSNAKYREYYSQSASAIVPGNTFEAILRAGIEAGQYAGASEDPDGFRRHRMDLRNQLGDPFEQRLGDGRWLMISDRRTREGGLVGIRTDITEIKRREAELEVAKTTLQRQAAELRLLADRERRANAAKSEFLATLSHEIRTPMNAVVGLSELLSGARLDPQSERYVVAINEAANQLLHLINTILDLSRLEAGRAELDMEAFGLKDMLARLVGVASALAASKPVQVKWVAEPGLPDTVLGDQGRLYQVLLNLLANSVKFTRIGSVSLRAGPSQRGQDWVRFTVTDTGPGLPENVVDRLFEPFVRGGESVEGTTGGTGLGLAISQRFIDLMDGEIGVASTSSKGTIFFVELRLAPAVLAADLLPPAMREPGDDRVLRILVAEDTPSSRMVVKAMLDKLGHQSVCVENGREALEALKQSRFDAVLMDMQMPVMDGVAATRAIRSLPGDVATVPIVFLTAQALPDARRDAQEAGTDHYLTKPARLADLRVMLAKVTTASPAEKGMGDASPGVAGEASVSALRAQMEPALAELRDVLPAAALMPVLARFLQDAVERTDAMQAAMQSGRVEEACREAHRLAGVFGQVGLRDLAATARRTSRLDGDAARQALASLGGQCLDAVAVLKAVVADAGSATSAAAE
jgi:signal transduction histidine kinase/DNA-binding response OmpR family regulator